MNNIFESTDNRPEKRKKLIEGLRDKGIENEGTVKLLQEWMIEQEEKVERAGATLEARVNFEFEQAMIYKEAGYFEEALDALYDILDMVEQENNSTLEEKIRKEIEIINNTDESY